MNPLKVLITGAAGFIGRALTNRLLSNEYSITAVDCLPQPNTISHYPVKWHTFDIISLPEDDLKTYLRHIDVCVHLAGQPSIWFSNEQPASDLLTNTYSTIKIYRAALHAGVKRFIYASTIAVFKPSLTAPGENTAIDPQSPYGISKACSENYLKLFSNKHPEMETLVFRPSYIVGTNIGRNVVYDIAKAFATSTEIDLFTSPYSEFDFIDIDDVVSGLVKLCTHNPINPYNIIHFCHGRNLQVMKIIQYYEGATNIKLTISGRAHSLRREIIGMKSNCCHNYGIEFRSILHTDTLLGLYERLKREMGTQE
jgi:nucleoside-diphosphate-sugar epimerase